MDLGTAWPTYVRVLSTLLGVVVLCRTAWRHPTWGGRAGGAGVLCWWVLALAPWLLRAEILRLAGLLGLDLPGSHWEYVPPPPGGPALLAFIVLGTLLPALAFGGPAAAVVASGRWTWGRLRGSNVPRMDRV